MKYIENHDTAPEDERAFSPSEVDDLSHEIEQVRNNPELLAFLAERSRETETFSLDDVKRKLGL
jgi:uncharacterized protein YfkK (UPF0435 family)